MSNATLDPEAIVRQYLLFLEDPSRLIDEAEVRRLEGEASGATDPIERLKALAALARARSVDGSAYEQAFVRVARGWASDNAIPASTFAELGVPEATLRTAGLLTSAKSSAARSRRSTGGRGRSVSAKEIQAHIATLTHGSFTLADIASSVGGSPMTIRKAVDGLVQSGTLRRLGPTPKWAGPGRAPILFTLGK
ncbi:MAG: hypothetical protein JWL72_1273 [Ilumatobacteraceae bacterium]|nr:hypothetical protein [Ilumatobacteraceae bacterium]MCU1387935.1 hypothetical protein [Ilumatobacteraceae bacterium]